MRQKGQPSLGLLSGLAQLLGLGEQGALEHLGVDDVGGHAAGAVLEHAGHLGRLRHRPVDDRGLLLHRGLGGLLGHGGLQHLGGLLGDLRLGGLFRRGGGCRRLGGNVLKDGLALGRRLGSGGRLLDGLLLRDFLDGLLRRGLLDRFGSGFRSRGHLAHLGGGLVVHHGFPHFHLGRGRELFHGYVFRGYLFHRLLGDRLLGQGRGLLVRL